MHSCIHSYIHPYIHPIHPSIAYANCCITTLHIVSRSGSHLIRHERQLTEVRRPAHEGLEATSCRTEPGEKTQMSPCGLGPTHLEVDRVISTFSFNPNLEPSPQNLHQGEVSRPPESLSGVTQASTGRWVKEQWNTT